MKLIVVLCLVAVAYGATITKIDYPKDNVQLTHYENENLGGLSYRYAFGQTDGTKQEQEGRIINEGKDDESIAIRGTFSWVGPDGVTYTVNYVADDDGYQPQIEQGPGGGVPPAVVASLLG